LRGINWLVIYGIMRKNALRLVLEPAVIQQLSEHLRARALAHRLLDKVTGSPATLTIGPENIHIGRLVGEVLVVQDEADLPA
jgi:hypothetical protein